MDNFRPFITDQDVERYDELFGGRIAEEIMKACLDVEYGSVTINITKGKPVSIQKTQSLKVDKGSNKEDKKEEERSYSPDE